MIIRTASHRARDRVVRALDRELVGLWNGTYSGSYGLTQVTDSEWEKIKDIPGVTRSRVKRSDLYECWSVFEKE